MLRSFFLVFQMLVLLGSPTVFGEDLDRLVRREMKPLLETYKTLHQNPELSYFEEKTAAFVAEELRALGFTVTEKVGRYTNPDLTCYGVVGVLENGPGPTVLLRTDLDALPVEEKTGLPYASRVTTRDRNGEEVPVMHACGHDIHMTVFLGTARLLSRLKDQWQGTLVCIGQPAEETGSGARAMLKDGLFERFPRPDFALALHDDPFLEAGRIGVGEGYFFAGSNSVDIRVRGKGGHGAMPDQCRDPIVVAARLVEALQTIVSRECSPLDPAVITVGSIHGGTKHNIIPDEVKLELTVRTFKESVRQKVLAAIERTARGVAEAAGMPPEEAPVVKVLKNSSTPPLYNDPALTRRLRGVWEETLGKEKVLAKDPLMVGEDFARYSLENHEIPICLFWLGTVNPEKMRRSQAEGVSLPPLHAPDFAPDPEPTIETGIKAMTAAVLDLAGATAPTGNAFTRLEERLLAAKSFRVESRITSKGPFESSLEGSLVLAENQTLQLDFSGQFGGNPVHLLLEAGPEQMRGGTEEKQFKLETPPALREGLMIGLTRMGLLHNLAMLSASAPPDRTDGTVKEWVQVFGVEAGEEKTVNGVLARAYTFKIVVAEQPAGEAVLWLNTETGLPVRREQIVHFGSQDMQVIEIYQSVEISEK